MAEPFLGEIQAFAFGFAPVSWLPCDGRLLQVQQFATLFSLIGPTYGGNGSTNFALPNLVGHVAINQGQGPAISNRVIGEQVGEANVTLSSDEMPRHTHTMQLLDKTSANGSNVPMSAGVMMDPSFNGFAAPPAKTMFAPITVANAGGSQPHANIQPTLAMIYCICIDGNYPSFS